MSVRYRLGATSITSLAVNQWGNKQGDSDATTLPVEGYPASSGNLGVFPANDQRRWQIGSVGIIPNLLLTTLAVVVVASTAVTRAPTYQAPKTKPAITVVQQSNLLTTTLGGVVAPPIVPGVPLTLPRPLTPLADTSRGTPGVLQIVAPAPFVPVLQPSLQGRPWILSDTSNGEIKPDVQAPVGESAAWAPIALVRNVVDTTQKQPITLQAIVVPPPIVNAPNYGPQRQWFQPFDSTEGTAKVLIPDKQPPVFNASPFAPVRQSWQPQDSSQPMSVALIPVVTPSVAVVRGPTFANLQRLPHLVSDTTSGSPIVQQTAPVIPPVVVATQFGPVRQSWQPASTSAGTPKTLTADAQIPVQNVQLTPPDRVRPVVDTSRSTQLELFPDLLPPGRSAFLPVPDQERTVVDTSESSAKTLYGDKIPPIVNLAYPTPDRIRPVTDTSQSTQVGLFPIPLPIGEQVWIGPHRVPVLPADTTRGSYATFFPPAAILPVPIGTALVLPAPMYLWPVTDTTQESPPVAIQGVLPPVDIPYVQPPQGTGGHGKPHRRRHYVEIDGQYFEVRDHEHAVEILTALHEEAKKLAPTAVKEALKEAKEVVVPKMAVVKSTYKPEFMRDLRKQVEEANARIEETYRQAMAEHQAWQAAIAKRDAEDEEDIIALVALGIL